MEVILRGVRGSIASPSSKTLFYGGHTACVEVLTANGTLLIFDAGSGLLQLNEVLPKNKECHIFISHGHADHIQGLGFFAPLHNPENTTHIYAPEGVRKISEQFFDGSIFPLPFSSFKGKIVWHCVQVDTPIYVGEKESNICVQAFAAHHPGGGVSYKLHADNAIFFYSGDHEITTAPKVRSNTLEMLHGAHLAVVDAMYDRNNYQSGWGHSAWEDWVDLATEAGVNSLVLTHHKPTSTDWELDALQQKLLKQQGEQGPQLYVAREGMRFTPPAPPPFITQNSNWLSDFLDELNQYHEENAILDRILAKTREITGADAGTVFLAEGDELVFAYTHNDSLFTADSAYRYAYTTLRIPISKQSIAGYTADTGTALNLLDVYNLPADVPYHFNSNFDKSTGYRTQSMLTLPFFDHAGKVTGVLQLINSINPRTNCVCAFSPEMEKHVKTLAREAAAILERSALMRKNIYRMLYMASTHDPMETGPHAERVGSIAAELYQCRANKLNKNLDTTRYEKSRIRLAAMLHDIGKVGISDLILKKNGKLTDEEFKLMRAHTTMGATILNGEAEDIVEMAREIALHHHQKWNGTGYAASNDEGKLSGEDIPLAARITAVADVFDALVSPRCYKEPWSFERAMNLLREESGKHFDPMLVECMLEIGDILNMIYSRFPDNHTAAANESSCALAGNSDGNPAGNPAGNPDGNPASNTASNKAG